MKTNGYLFKCNKLWRVKSKKRKAGKLYDANNDIELVSEREACKEVCYELNSLRPSQKKERGEHYPPTVR